MSKYLEQERTKAVKLIQSGHPIFEGAIGGMKFLKKERPFVLQQSLKNLHPAIRTEAVQYFEENNISWWGGRKPTGHVLSSQIACLNHLFAIRKDKTAVLVLAQEINPEFVEVLLIESDKFSPGYIQFEAVSDIDHLNEGSPNRGSNCTSIDALIYARHKNGSLWLIPIEWKYTEHYANQDKAKEGYTKDPNGCKGVVRQRRYNDLIKNSTQLKSDDLTVYYFEPFYQLMRQTLWAEQIVANKPQERLKADNYIHVHVIPSANTDLLHKRYRCSGMNMQDTWRSYLRDQSQYQILTPQQLMAGLISNVTYEPLLDYLSIRYPS